MPPTPPGAACPWFSHLQLPFVRLHTPQPGLIVLELVGDVGDDLPHVEPPARPEVTLELGRL